MNDKLQQKLKNLEVHRIKIDTLLVEEMQKSHQLAKKIDQLEY